MVNFIKIFIRRKLLAHPRLYHLYRRGRIGLKRVLQKNIDMAERIEVLFPVHMPVNFVQVGSNDGRFGDPLVGLIKQRGNWSGVFVEPVPYAFERLKLNYGLSDQFAFEQLAVGECFETKTFYYVSEDAKLALGEQLPPWYDQLGSFDRAHILKHLDGVLEPYILEVPVDCVPLAHILEKNNVSHVDILHIDTEGFDYQVLKQFDLERYQPKVVLFEHKHLSNAELNAADALLVKHGYSLRKITGDTLAVRA